VEQAVQLTVALLERGDVADEADGHLPVAAQVDFESKI
jgi:hypothetical protein